ncbi:serine protease [Paenibacillus albidus]|uniref:Serine protease n=1 Tax=Paenibacillus albidus TaxID=2041023 RepID=A0A917D1Y4_9BACL|nr:S8 family peptidase [Paenibacillus albidus]GGG05972.1 serine protease [Paenibacillus albidus]
MSTLVGNADDVQLPPVETVSVRQHVKEIPKGVQMIQAPQFWEQGNYGKGIMIAVLDTGCDAEHPDLRERIIGGKNFTDDDDGIPRVYKDYNGHGTHVAGIIAATKNGDGVVGIAPEAGLLILKVLNRQGHGRAEWIAQAIHYAIDQNVQIISMSLSFATDHKGIHDAIKRAVDNDIIVVCAAGNTGKEEFRYPAGFNESTSVGAINFNSDSAPFLTMNNEIDLLAPGVEIKSTYPLELAEDKSIPYKILSGTSMAAPHVAGALALLINSCQSAEQFNRQLTEPELYAQLTKRTIPLGRPKSVEGNGLLYLTADKLLEEHLRQHPVNVSEYA